VGKPPVQETGKRHFRSTMHTPLTWRS